MHLTPLRASPFKLSQEKHNFAVKKIKNYDKRRIFRLILLFSGRDT